MRPMNYKSTLSPWQRIKSLLLLAIGAFLLAVAIQIFLLPHHIIDGGIVGVSMIAANLVGPSYLPIFLVIFNIPFVILAYRFLGKQIVIQMLIAIVLLAVFSKVLQGVSAFQGDTIEIIVAGGLILGIGVGLIIRYGGSTDGTEILAIILNQKMGFTVGQIILFINLFIFAGAGLIANNWNFALQSLMTYFIASKAIDNVIFGLDETKSVMIVSKMPQKITDAIVRQLGVGLTVLHGHGGYSGERREILFAVVERLQLAALKEIVMNIDPNAFVMIETVSEVLNGRIENLKRKASKRSTK